MAEQLLEVRNLRAAYGQSQIIENLSMNVGEKEIVAVMGLNGMGKTTLMKSLIGILKVKEGSVTLKGKNLTSLEACERVANGLAYVPQGRMVFPTLTVEENILTGLRSDKEDVPESLYELFPVLREMKRRKAGNLSGGQQQQLVIARALASKPKILLLDEPTEGIQPSIIKELAVVLRKIRDLTGLTIVVSEQVLSFALALADRFLMMDRGRIVHECRRDEVDEEHMKRLLTI